MVPQESLSIHNIETEQAVLGCILLDENVYDIVKDFIPESDVFYNIKNKQIWETMSDLRKENIPVDTVNVCSKIKGEAYYITGLLEKVPTTANAISYARQMNSDWLRRKLVVQSQKIAAKAVDSKKDINSLLEEVQNTASSLLNLEPGQKFDLDWLLGETEDSIFNQRNLVTTGINPLDEIISGMTKGEITIFAGRPGNAKTTTVANIARNLVMQGKKVIMFNREMPNTEMMKKFIAMESNNITYDMLRHNAISNKEKMQKSL